MQLIYCALCTVELHSRRALIGGADDVEVMVFCFPQLQIEVTMFPMGRRPQSQLKADSRDVVPSHRMRNPDIDIVATGIDNHFSSYCV